jgi:hypothetical protein
VYLQRNMEERSRNHCCSGKTIIITYSGCVPETLVSTMQCAWAVFSSVACPELHFSTLFHKRPNFRKKKLIEHKLCSDFLYNFCPKHFSFYEERSEIWSNTSSCKVLAILVRFQWNLNFFHRFSKNAQISNLMQILPVGAELFNADGRTERHDKANGLFSQFFKGV